jgi:hypothetical protein
MSDEPLVDSDGFDLAAPTHIHTAQGNTTMPIPLDTPGSSGPPAVKFDDVGSYVDIGIVKVDEVQSRDYETGDPEVWDNGDPRMHPRITGIVIAHNGATVGKDDDIRPVEVGELVSIYAQGSRWFTYRDARKEHGTVNCGDVMRWKFETTETPKNPKFRGNPRKVFVAKIRAAEGKDGDLVARCEAAYYEQRDRVTVDVAPADTTRYEEEPF